MRSLNLLLLLLPFLFVQCKKETAVVSTASMYFPPIGNAGWETTTPASLGWSEAALNDVYSLLEQKKTKAFIILKNGRIVSEKYFGSFTTDSSWYWASAGKTLTAFLVGIAQQEGKINIDARTSQYLGTGWTAAPLAKENLITVRHQLSMTSGLDDMAATGADCTLPSCLQYKADAGTRWSYHNAPYTLLEKVVEAATGTSYNAYFQQKIRDRIGMNGLWVKVDNNNVYFSTPRSMARFGLLMLNKGKWNSTSIFSDTTYFNNLVNSSQTLNPSYGYLTWLNGKGSYMMPTLQFSFNGNLVPNAPTDMYAALGKNDQKLYVVPSQQLVIIRMGESAGNSMLAASTFDNELWGKLKTLLKY
ncbi:serine hydrolase domain-containing protein [Aridibaculum aurantiacum]|uniref:serine hydrolase domain-containing protein n=1 Tax=Aridibaculum aurantiacum TaxID=2810307 RepID=UPI001F61C157|nr:serine hydrolase [Aridibaculum aurantiacum]